MRIKTAIAVVGMSGCMLLTGATRAGATGDDLILSGCEALAGGKTVPGWLRYMTVTLDDGQSQTWTNPDGPNYDDESFSISFSFPKVSVGDHQYTVVDSNGDLVSTYHHEVDVPPCPVPSTAAVTTVAVAPRPPTPAPAPPTPAPAPPSSTGAVVIETTTTAPPVETSALSFGPTLPPAVAPSVLSAGPTLPATGPNEATRQLAPIGIGFLAVGLLALAAVRRETRRLSPAARRSLGTG